MKKTIVCCDDCGELIVTPVGPVSLTVGYKTRIEREGEAYTSYGEAVDLCHVCAVSLLQSQLTLFDEDRRRMWVAGRKYHTIGQGTVGKKT